MSDEIKRKSFQAHFKANPEESGTVEAIVSVFGNVDSYNERVMAGAFADSLSRKLPKGVWMHQWDQPICKTVEAKELLPGDPLLPEALKELGGLYVKGQFYEEIDDSHQAYLKIKNGFIDEFSIGYRLKKWTVDDETKIWDLLELDLFEWSPVLVGANRATATLSVKQDLMGSSFGCSIEEHVDLLLKRIEDNFLARDAKGEVTDALINRLNEASEKILALVDGVKTRDVETTATTKTNALEWEALKHARALRLIRTGV